MRKIKNKWVSFGESSFNATGVFFQTFLCWQVGVVMAYVMQGAASGGAMPGDMLLFALVASEVLIVGNSLIEAGKSFWAKFSRDEDYSGPFGRSQHDQANRASMFECKPPTKTQEEKHTCGEKAGGKDTHHRGCSCCHHRPS